MLLVCVFPCKNLRPSLDHRLYVYYTVCGTQQVHFSVSVMAQFCVTLLTFWLLLYICVQSQSKSKDTCIYQGDEDTYSFYEDGDVVLGGILPLHSSTIPFISTFTSKPKLIKYKL